MSNGSNVLADPWPTAEVVGYLPPSDGFDSPHTKLVVHNDYAEVVLKDGTMGWIPISAGVSVFCARP